MLEETASEKIRIFLKAANKKNIIRNKMLNYYKKSMKPLFLISI